MTSVSLRNLTVVTQSSHWVGQKRGTAMKNTETILERPVNRRSFIKNGALAAGAATVGAGLLSHGLAAFAEEPNSNDTLNKGDIAILQFLAAAELIESDL